MSIFNLISRVSAYGKRNGLRATVCRFGVETRRALFANRMVVFYCDLAKETASPAKFPSSLKVERLGNYAELPAPDLQEMISFWNPDRAHRDIRERFEQGASLWLIRSGDRLAGYSWTIQGRTIAQYYFPMAQDDVQLFDFYVFPKFRGRAILWFLITHILHNLQAEGASRVFGDVAEWNEASLSFYKTVPFHRLGMVRTFTILGYTLVYWDQNVELQNEQKSMSRKQTIGATGREGVKIQDVRT
jgi:ribosomal protein S18 acetylase RimI-like enzyme